MIETAQNPGSHILWLEALKAKYLRKGNPYAKAEFDKLLGKYSVGSKSKTCFPILDALLRYSGDHRYPVYYVRR